MSLSKSPTQNCKGTVISELVVLRGQLLKNFKGQTMVEAEKSLAKLTNETNRLRNNENALPVENSNVELSTLETGPNRRFSNLLNIKTRLAKRISKLGSLENTFHRIEQQNKESEQTLLVSVIKALKTIILNKKPPLSDSEFLQMLETLDMKTIDIERFVILLDRRSQITATTNKTDFTVITKSNHTDMSMDNR